VSSPKRQPLLVLLALLLPLLLVAGIWLGGHPDHLPTFAQDLFVADHDTRAVNEAIDRVAHDYYRPVSRSALASSSISGMLASLHDPYSSYLSPRALRQFDRPGSFTGIGVEVKPSPRGLEVERVFDSSPAQRGGLKVGELIVAVNGRPLRGLSSATSTGLIKGPPGTDVRLTLEGRRGARRTITVTRATISQPVVASALRTLHGTKLG
jgi:carboxyl-terminal processing protease